PVPAVQQKQFPTDDFASDMFSLGVMLFEMLAGLLPYASGTLEETYRRRHNDRPRNIHTLVPDVPRPLATLVHRLLASQPDARPRASQVVQQLVALEIATLAQRKAA